MSHHQSISGSDVGALRMRKCGMACCSFARLRIQFRDGDSPALPRAILGSTLWKFNISYWTFRGLLRKDVITSTYRIERSSACLPVIGHFLFITASRRNSLKLRGTDRTLHHVPHAFSCYWTFAGPFGKRPDRQNSVERMQQCATIRAAASADLSHHLIAKKWPIWMSLSGLPGSRSDDLS
jgi:hypothetical protein